VAETGVASAARGIAGPIPRRRPAATVDGGLRAIALIAVLAAIAVLVGLPLAALGGAAARAGPTALAEAARDVAPVALDSAWTGIAAAFLAVVAGTGLAIAIELLAVPGARALRLLAVVPLVIPGYVVALGWIAAYGPAGLLDLVAGLGQPALFGPLGVVIVVAVEATPLAFLVVAAALARPGRADVERAARASGAGPWTVLATVTLPSLRPAIRAAAALCLVVSLTAFGVPAELGAPAGFGTATTRIYQDLAFSSDPAAFTQAILLSLGLAVVVAAAVALVLRTLPPASPPVVAESVAPVRRRSVARLAVGSGPRAAAAGVAWAFVVACCLIPLLGLVLTALTPAVGVPPTPDHWTLRNLAATLDARAARALGTSLLLGVLTATGVILLGSLAVFAGRSSSGAARTGLGGPIVLAFAMPGTTLAVGVLVATGPWLGGTLAILLLADLAKLWALGRETVAAGFATIPAGAVRAARASGASPPAVAGTILVPLLRPAIAVGWLLALVFALHEITMSSLLSGPTTRTLAVEVLNLQQLGDPTRTAAQALVLTAVLAFVAVPLAFLPRRQPGAIASAPR
jgi:iron(III) transport system permease protein